MCTYKNQPHLPLSDLSPISARPLSDPAPRPSNLSPPTSISLSIPRIQLRTHPEGGQTDQNHPVYHSSPQPTSLTREFRTDPSPQRTPHRDLDHIPHRDQGLRRSSSTRILHPSRGSRPPLTQILPPTDADPNPTAGEWILDLDLRSTHTRERDLRLGRHELSRGCADLRFGCHQDEYLLERALAHRALQHLALLTRLPCKAKVITQALTHSRTHAIKQSSQKRVKPHEDRRR